MLLFINIILGQRVSEFKGKVVPVITEGEYDTLSTVYFQGDTLYLGIGVLGKHISSDQMRLIKKIFKSRELVILALDGSTKNDDPKEVKRFTDLKESLEERFLAHFERVVTWELGFFERSIL